MRKKLQYFILIPLFLANWSAFAQQDAQLSQYMFNPLYINPASAGMDGTVHLEHNYLVLLCH
jgi:hypothetical protein